MKQICLFLLILPFLLFADDKVVPVVVIGSGPAGLSSSLVTAREKIETHLFLGSQIGGPANAITCLGNWPGAVPGKGNVILERLISQVKEYGVHFHPESIEHVDFSIFPFSLWTSSGEEIKAKSVIIASGSQPRFLGLKGENEYLHKGIYPSVYKKDAPFYSGKTVAIVGGGIDATKKAKIVARTARKVYVIVRKSKMQKDFMQKKLENLDPIVEIIPHSLITELRGNEQHLTHITVSTPIGFRELPVDALILAIGIVPNTQLYRGQLECDEEGAIVLQGRSQRTNVPGVFAAGNVTKGSYHQAAISAAEGMKAGYDVIEFLNHLSHSPYAEKQMKEDK